MCHKAHTLITRIATVAALTLLSWHAARADEIDFVIQLSVDGLRGDLLEDLINNDLVGDYANFKRFVDEGATTFNARTDFTHTNTIPNHTSMVTGRPVLQPAGQPNTVHHGYTLNTFPAPTDTLHNAGNPNLSYIASTFDIAHDNGLSTALYASKTKFIIYEQSYNAANGAPDVTGPDNGTDKIDSYVQKSTGFPSNASNLHADYITDMGANHFNYTFLHYKDPDLSGHINVWGSAGWNNSVADVDDYLADVFNLVETDVTLAGKTAIILTADHGGTGTGHSTATLVENYTVPFFVWGPDVKAGKDLYKKLNLLTRLDPGATRPDYNAATQPIRNGDGGNLALDLLGLGPVTGSTINDAQDLTGALLGDGNLDGTVSFADFGDLQVNFSQPGTWTEGDYNRDGLVTFADFSILQTNFGTTVTAPVVVPEPASLALLGVGGIALLHRRNRRRGPRPR